MMPLLMTTLMQVVPEHDRGRVMGNVSLAISVAPAIGPAVSGVILQFGSWRCCSSWCSRSPVPSRSLGLRRARVTSVSPGSGTIDWSSVVTAAARLRRPGLRAQRVGLRGGDARVAVASCGGLVGIAVFVWRQLVLQRAAGR